MKAHAEVEAYRILANPAILGQQVMANMAVAVSKNNLSKAKEYVDAKRAAGALRVNEGDGEPSAVAALLGME
jgi:tRNA A22 N-methylase